jgi:hypothetical protein
MNGSWSRSVLFSLALPVDEADIEVRYLYTMLDPVLFSNDKSSYWFILVISPYFERYDFKRWPNRNKKQSNYISIVDIFGSY